MTLELSRNSNTASHSDRMPEGNAHSMESRTSADPVTVRFPSSPGHRHEHEKTRPAGRVLRKTVLGIVVLGVIAAITGASVWFSSLPPEVAVSVPQRGPAVEVLYATGVVESKDWARISPKAGGRIMELLADEGDFVTKGQPLMRLDDEEARALLAQAEALEAYYRDDLERQKTLAKSGTVSRGTLDRVNSDYLQAQAAVTAARRRVHDLTIISSKAGVILRRDGEVGEVVGSDDVLFRVGQPRPLRITADVDEEDIARVTRGQRVLIKADSFSDRILEGTVDHVTPMGDSLNKSFRVRIDIADDVPLMPGMNCEINIVVREDEKALLIPGTALGKYRGNESVFVEENGLAHRRPVQTGANGQKMVEVLSGLDETDVILTTPPPGLSDGDEIRPVSVN